MLLIILPGKATLVLFDVYLSIEKMGHLSDDNKSRTSLGLDIWSALPANTRGILLMAAFAGTVSLGHVIARHLTQEFHPMQVAFFRTFVPLVILTPILMSKGPGWWHTTRPGLQLLRGLIGGISMLTWFYTLSLIPVANATALSFTVVIFASLGAVFFLGERMGRHRWTAIFFGVVGTLIILRPFDVGLNPGALVALVSSILWAAALICVKVLSRTDSSVTIVFYSSVYFTILAGIPAAYFWIAPELIQLGLLICVGLLATIAQLCMTGALKIAETTAVMPIDFTRLLWAAALGFIWFGEFPDPWTWIGSIIVFTSTMYITYRENLMELSSEDRSIKDQTDRLR